MIEFNKYKFKKCILIKCDLLRAMAIIIRRLMIKYESTNLSVATIPEGVPQRYLESVQWLAPKSGGVGAAASVG